MFYTHLHMGFLYLLFFLNVVRVADEVMWTLWKSGHCGQNDPGRN